MKNFQTYSTKALDGDNEIGFSLGVVDEPTFKSDLGNNGTHFVFEFHVNAKNQKEAARKLRDYINC